MTARRALTLAAGCLAVVVLLELFGPRQADGTVADWQFVVQLAAIVVGVVALIAATVIWRRRGRRTA